MTQLLDGKKLSEQITQQLKFRVRNLKIKPCLVVILVGDNPSSLTYVKMKEIKAKEIGCDCKIYKFNKDILESELIERIEYFNKAGRFHGIMVQQPLPSHLNNRRILDSIRVDKDVDGLNSDNLKLIAMGEEEKAIIPCTPKGILTMMNRFGIEIEGKNVCVIGYSNIVGKPLALMLINRKATVTICRSKSDLKKHTLESDIIISATGKPHLIKEEHVKKGQVIIDVGIEKVNNKLVGDVDFDNVSSKCSAISHVPGGVGPMTVISLMENLVEILEKKEYNHKTKIKCLCQGKQNIFVYVSKSDEQNTFWFINKMIKDGKKVIVPVTKGTQIIPCRLKSVTHLQKTALGIKEPVFVEPFRKEDIDIFFVPGTKFDKQGNRIGRGLGCFDRFLADVKGKKPIIGLCLKEQFVEEIKPEKWDVPVDEVIVE